MDAAFDAGPDRSGPLTWGQKKIRAELLAHPEDRYLPFVPMLLPVPAGTGVAAVVAALSAVLVAHESLRHTSPDETSQRVTGRGRLPVGLVETEDVDEVLEGLCRDRFDLAAELPLRAVIALRSGEPHTLVCAFSHMAVDALGLGVVMDQLRALIVAPATEQSLRTSIQPLELARSQLPTDRRTARTLEHWRTAYAAAPQAMLEVPDRAVKGSRYCEAKMSSPAMAAAVATVARRTKASPSAVMFAATARVLGTYCGLDRCAITSISGNRASRELAEYVGTISQDALTVVDLGAPTFDALVREAWLTALNAYRNSMVDCDAQRTVRDEVMSRRGVVFRRDFVYSDLALGAGEPPGDTTITVEDADFLWVRGYLTVYRLTEVAELGFWADTRYLPRKDLRMFLESLERLLVFEAGGCATPPEITPAARGPEWVRAESSWISLTACQELVDHALGPGVAWVRHEAEVVAYLTGTPPTDPRAACLAALPSFDAAMVPIRFIEA